jgi:hypothetical protein
MSGWVKNKLIASENMEEVRHQYLEFIEKHGE